MNATTFSRKHLPAVRGFVSFAVGLILAAGVAGAAQAQSGSAAAPDSRYQGGWGGGHRHGGPRSRPCWSAEILAETR